MKRIKRLYNTIKYLKINQVFFRIYFNLKNIVPQKLVLNTSPSLKQHEILFYDMIPMKNSMVGKYNFHFLNKVKDFSNSELIDWNFQEYGKLWCYNLNYFDFLNQKDITYELGSELIHQYIEDQNKLKDGLDPYPISLRNINWIKFISKHSSNELIDSFLLSTYHHLLKNIEYHLLGNHLIENGFSVLFGAYYFQNQGFLNKSLKILIKELDEQILEDGAHFELSPMYHQLILFRLLDAINLVKNNSTFKNSYLLNQMLDKAGKMLSWLTNVTFSNGQIPMVNDSTDDIAPSTESLINYAKRLDVTCTPIPLNDSGYRMIKKNNYELFVDVGNIGPDYIPGHAHSDTFNYILCINQQPYIVETGISTYEKNQIRHLQRSTESHNTVKINNINQSDVWGGFRVGARAKIKSLHETNQSISATHDGYKSIGITVERKWLHDDTIIILDSIHNMSDLDKAFSYLHFHPNVLPIINGKTIKTQFGEISIEGSMSIHLDMYDYCLSFNKTSRAYVAKIEFMKSLKTEFIIY